MIIYITVNLYSKKLKIVSLPYLISWYKYNSECIFLYVKRSSQSELSICL